MKQKEYASFNLGSADFQNLFAGIRILLIFSILWVFGAYCSINFHDVDPRIIAQSWREQLPMVFGSLPDALLVPFTAVINPYSLRYLITPLAAITLVIIAGAYFVQDVYAIKKYKDSLRYVLASMFAMDYPALVIDKHIQTKANQADNLINKIGGPGYVLVEPGNAAIFRHLREPGLDLVAATHFLAPFETIAKVIDLDEQQGDKDEIKAMTRDGIMVVLRDIHMRYRIKQAFRDGKPARKTLNDPYPLAPNALHNMLYNMTVSNSGPDNWNEAVERVIVGGITDFIAEHTIDYLTAPRGGTPNPRIELNNELFYKSAQRALEGYGAELLWVDVGHMDIPYEGIDDQRANLWASEWIGDITVSKAYSQAIRQAYQELGRAQAQAEMILSIADALRTANFEGGGSRENLRKMLLARTAQVLDSINRSSSGGENQGDHD